MKLLLILNHLLIIVRGILLFMLWHLCKKPGSVGIAYHFFWRMLDNLCGWWVIEMDGNDLNLKLNGLWQW